MSSQSKIKARSKLAGMIVALGATLGGCSDIYFDRRETIALSADDHIAANRVAQMVDPWPRYVGNKNIAFNGRAHAGRGRALPAPRGDPAGPAHDEHVFPTVAAGAHHHGAHQRSGAGCPGSRGGGCRCAQVSV